MVPASPSSATVYKRAPAAGPGPGASLTVVRLRGEQGPSTDPALCRALARALALDGDAVVVDLREAEPMSLSTLAVIVRARELFGLWSRSVTIQSPSASARRLISICGLKDLLGPKDAHGTAGTALASWVDVPATRRAGRRPSRPAAGTARVGERAGQDIDLREAASRTVDLRAEQTARTA